MTLDELATPCLVLDRQVLVRNIERMRTHAASLGVALRPHMKTAKSIDVARLVLTGEEGITVSTLSEAEYFADHGVRDVLYAVGIVPSKLERVARLRARGVRLTIILDSVEMARAVVGFAREHDTSFEVLVEIDTDGHRAGVRPDDPRLLEIATALDVVSSVELRGVMTHAGGAYDCTGPEEIVGHAELERRQAVRAAELLRSRGWNCPVVSVGSTPTAALAATLEGVTEIRPGNFVFMDLYQVGLGVCALDDLALSVHGCVIGHAPDRNRILIDAGALALSKDLGTASQAVDQRYGLVVEPRTGNDHLVVDVNQEHGMVSTRDGSSVDRERFAVGRAVRVLPVHACMTAAAYDRYHVVDGGREVVATWKRCGGW